MTRKDYELIAAILREADTYMTQRGNGTIAPDVASALRFVAGSFALESEMDNPRFNRDRFFTACGDTFADSLA